MEKRRVVVTGLGAVTPIGNTAPESWAGAREGRCGIAPITRFDTEGFKVKLAAEVKDLVVEDHLDKREAKKMARFTQLALIAAAEAFAFTIARRLVGNEKVEEARRAMQYKKL